MPGDARPEKLPEDNLYIDENNPEKVEVLIGGQRFVLREISGGEFFDIVSSTTDPVTGITDIKEFTRKLRLAMVVEPKLDPEKDLKPKYSMGLFAECQKMLGITGETLKNLIAK